MAKRGCVCAICDGVSLPSVCANCINYRLVERHKLIKNLTQERDALRRRFDEELLAKREAELQQHWRVEHSERRARLTEKLRRCKESFLQEKTKHYQMQHDLDENSRSLSAASGLLEKKKSELLDRYYPDLIRAQSLVYTSVASELHQKRRAIFRQLSKILPLRRSSIPAEVPQSVRICGARLPIGDDPLSTPPMELAASLGYFVQLVNMAARYTSGPLLHSSGFAASSSRVWQRASYFDSRPTNRSEEFPLFLPRHDRRGGSSSSSSSSFGNESGFEFSKSVGSNLGFSNLESPRIDALESTASLVSYGQVASSGSREAYPDVQRGIKQLRRSVGCVCAYAFGQLNLPVPPDMPIFDAFAELLSMLSSKDIRSRSSRRNQQPNGRFGLSEGPFARLGSGLLTLSEGNRFSPESLGQRVLTDGVTNWNEEYEYNTDSEHNEAAPSVSDSSGCTDDDWNLVEHPRLPPPSQSEDIMLWTRAHFMDATK